MNYKYHHILHETFELTVKPAYQTKQSYNINMKYTPPGDSQTQVKYNKTIET